MSMLSDDDALTLLKESTTLQHAFLSTDLWPRIRERIDRGTRTPSVSDWLLVAALLLLVLLNPSLLGILLLHF